MEKKLQHMVKMIAGAVEIGFTFDECDSVEEVFAQAIEYIEDNGSEVMTQCDFDNQRYVFVDVDGFGGSCSGEIFDFTRHYKASDEKLFKHEDDGSFTPVNWYDIPEGENRENYIFVFDRVACIDGTVAVLYDYFK